MDSIEEAPMMRFESFEIHTLVAHSKREQSIHMKDTQKVPSKEATKGPFEGYAKGIFKRPSQRRKLEANRRVGTEGIRKPKVSTCILCAFFE